MTAADKALTALRRFRDDLPHCAAEALKIKTKAGTLAALTFYRAQMKTASPSCGAVVARSRDATIDYGTERAGR